MMHHQLTKLAVERSPEKRLELLHKVTDLYFEGVGEHTTSESYLFNEIMERIVDMFSRDMKREVSASLAILPDFPGTIVRKLADDEDVEVARPVLRSALSLTEDDLVRLAQRGSQAHLTAIAGRATLPEKVTDVLIDRGGREVVHTVTANHGARFSDYGMGRLVEKCEEDVDLRELLVERPDLSPHVVEKLVPLLSESLVMKLAERGYEVHGALPPDMIAQLRQRFTAALKQRKENILRVSLVIDQIRQGKMQLDDAVRHVAESGRLLDAAALLAAFVRLERDQVFQQIYRGQLQTVLIICRALDLTWPTLDAILAVRAAKQQVRYFSDPTVRRDYEAVDPLIAQRAIRFLRVRQVAIGRATSQAGRDPMQAGAA
jgi:Uncharacterised protein conserved in bacteria (DUF2336)